MLPINEVTACTQAALWRQVAKRCCATLQPLSLLRQGRRTVACVVQLKDLFFASNRASDHRPDAVSCGPGRRFGAHAGAGASALPATAAPHFALIVKKASALSLSSRSTTARRDGRPRSMTSPPERERLAKQPDGTADRQGQPADLLARTHFGDRYRERGLGLAR